MPSYPDTARRALSERLEAARAQLLSLRRTGVDTAEVEREIHDLQRALRGDAGQLCDALREELARSPLPPYPPAEGLSTAAHHAPPEPADPERAVELLDEALDRDPGDLEAFERIKEILTAREAWKPLERAYRRMLRRVTGKGTTDLEFDLWHALGLVYRDRLAAPDAAIEAFKMASRYRPQEVEEHEILAALHEAAGQADQAIASYRSVLRIDPGALDPYRKLFRLQRDKRAYDEAWWLAAALAFLRQADPEETRFFEDHRLQGIPVVRSRLDDEQWVRNLFHEEESLHVGKIFEMIAPSALEAKIQSLQATRQVPVLPPKFRQDPATSKVTMARIFGWAAQVLGLAVCPHLYVRIDVPGALVAVPSQPPASVAGQTVLTGFSSQELLFVIGKHLAMYRGEHYLKTLFPTVTELTVLLFAAITLVAPDAPSPPDIAKQVVATTHELRRLIQPVHLAGLRVSVKRFLADGAKTNVKRWAQTVELTACRAGLLLCGDLEIARKIIAAEPPQRDDLAVPDKLQELLRFSVSEQHHALRAALGIAIAVGS